ncbi:hypothetical protein H9P43_007672 [Blastocladiella emersonii ATCC 22665]|nr:hypothetical protein H9P43_007672 [Blastocladiella emersonii ATCC 22665]
MDRINALPEGGMLPGMESRATRVNNADLEASGRSGVHDDNLQAEESAISPPAQMVEMLQVPMGSTPVSESSVGLTLMAFPHTTFMFVVNNMILKKLIGFETRCRVPRALYDTAAATMDGILLTTLDTNLELVMQGKTVQLDGQVRSLLRWEMRALILLSGLPDFFVTPNPYDVNSPIVAIMSGLSRDLVMDMDGKFAHAHERRVGHYGIVEAQGRGTLHIHVLGKSPNVPPQAVIARNIQLLGILYFDRIPSYLDGVVSNDLYSLDDRRVCCGIPPAAALPLTQSSCASQPAAAPFRDAQPGETVKLAFDLTGREHPVWTGLPESYDTPIDPFAHINHMLQEGMMHKHGHTCYKNVRPGELLLCRFHFGTNGKTIHEVTLIKLVPDPETGELKAVTYLAMTAANPANVMYYITNYVAKQIALDLIRKGEETWVSTTYIFAHGPLYQFLRMVTNAAGSDASGNTTGAQPVGEDGAAAVDDEREREQEDDEIDDERITFSNRQITDKLTIANLYMHRPNELESLSPCRVEPIKAATNGLHQSVPDDDADDGNAPRAKRGRHAEPRFKFRGMHAAVGKLIVAMRATKVVPVPLFNKQVSQSSDIGSTESRAMISMILFKPFRAIDEVVPGRGETWSQTLDLFKNTLEQGSDRLRWINNFRDYVNTSPGKLVDDSEADNSATPEQVDLRRAGGTGMGSDDDGDGEIMPAGIALEAHNNDAFLHEILSSMYRSDQHAAELLASALNYKLLWTSDTPVSGPPFEPRQQLLKVDSESAWLGKLVNNSDLAKKAEQDAHR